MTTLNHPRAWVSAIWLVLCTPGCADDELCNAARLQAALDAASPGETVRMGACRVNGVLTVPAGVSLAGAGVDRSVLITPADTIGVRLLGMSTTLSGLSIESQSDLAVLGRGAGTTVLREVSVRASRGAAVAFDGASAVELDRVNALGAIDAASSMEEIFVNLYPRTVLMEGDSCPTGPEPSCTEGEVRNVTCPTCGPLLQACVCGGFQTVTSMHGLLFLGVSTVTLTDVDVRGFAQRGVVVYDTDARGGTAVTSFTWRRGLVAENIGVGLDVQGSVTTTLESVSIVQTLRGVSPDNAWAGFFSGADVTTRNVEVSDNEQYGLVHLSSRAIHEGFTGQRNGRTALSVGASDRFEVANATISDNGFAGIRVADSSNVTVRDSVVRDQTSGTRSEGVAGRVTVGDGLHLTNTTTAVSVARTRFENNERIGLLVDLRGTMGAGITFDGVEVSGTGAQLGAVAGNAVPMGSLTTVLPGTDGWDTGIMRSGSAAMNDGTPRATEDVAQALLPTEVPSISGLVAPCD